MGKIALPPITPQVPHPRLYDLCRRLVRGLCWLCRCRVTGLENVPGTGPVIIASNHQSYADPPLLSRITRRPLSYIAKEELFRIPLMGRFIVWVNAFPVRRGTADLRALRAGLQVLAAGRCLVIFPEGMRSPDGRLLQPELGVALIALKSRAPVLPVALDGSNRVLPRKPPILRPARFSIRVGAPIAFDELYDKRHWEREDLEYVARTIMEGIAAQLGQTFRWEPRGEKERDGASGAAE